MLRKNVASQYIGIPKVSTTDGSRLTGFPALIVSKDGGAFATCTGSIVADVAGASVYGLSQGDTNANQLVFQAILAGMVPFAPTVVTTAADPTDATNFGLAGFNNISSNLGGLTSAQLSGFATVQVNTNNISANLGGLTSAQLSGLTTLQTSANNTSAQVTGIASAQTAGFAKVTELHEIHGLESGSPLTVTATSRAAASITQTISTAGGTTTVTR